MTDSTTSSSSPAEYASRIINQTNRHIFLTGKAGTGKTTFLRRIIKETHKKAIVVAPTGIAAINAGGVTLHSQFQLPFGAYVPSHQFQVMQYPYLKLNSPETIVKHLQMNSSKRQVLNELELLIIDEVSMLRADLLDAIDFVLKFVRRDQSSFGGIQVLFIGDLLQLPPVVKDEEWKILQKFYKSILFFDAQVLQQDKPLYIELDKIYRQNDPVFIGLLNNLRNDRLRQEDIDLLNKYYKPGTEVSNYKNSILLTTHNNKADAKNKETLHSLKGNSFVYEAVVQGDFNEYSYPVEYRLELKPGAQVMFIKNDPSGEQKFFNGKIAIIKSLNQEEIVVQFEDTKTTLVLEKYTWKNLRYSFNEDLGEIEENEIGSFTQYPIKLAWAITVHKSQGLTFEKAILDINKAFAPGQIYVALSRLKSLEGLVLTEPIKPLMIRQKEDILEFAALKDEQGNLKEILDQERDLFTKTFLVKCFNFAPLVEFLTHHSAGYKKDSTHSNKQKHHAWALNLCQESIPFKDHADRFCSQIRKMMEERKDNYFEILSERIEAASNYFTPKLKEFIQKVKQQREILKKDKKVKTYLKELEEVEGAFLKQLRAIHKSESFIKSIVQKTDLTRQALHEMFEKKGLTKDKETQPFENKAAKGPEEKIEKVNTKQASFTLFQQGLSISEIAKVRSLAHTTVEGHLAHYISTGEIDVSVFLSPEKARLIIEVAEKLDNPSLNTLKQELGEEYSFSDLKFANAFKKFNESQAGR